MDPEVRVGFPHQRVAGFHQRAVLLLGAPHLAEQLRTFGGGRAVLRQQVQVRDHSGFQHPCVPQAEHHHAHLARGGVQGEYHDPLRQRRELQAWVPPAFLAGQGHDLPAAEHLGGGQVSRNWYPRVGRQGGGVEVHAVAQHQGVVLRVVQRHQDAVHVFLQCGQHRFQRAVHVGRGVHAQQQVRQPPGQA